MTIHKSLFTSLSILLLIASIAPRLYGQDLNVYMTVDSDVVAAGDHVTYTVTVTNSGATDLLSVDVQIHLPPRITRFSRPPGWRCDGVGNCHADVTYTWTVGTLAPGESRRTVYRTRIVTDAQPQVIGSAATASASNASDAQTSRNVSIVTSPALRLSLAPDSGPAEPGRRFSYTVTYANDGSATPTAAELSMPIPAGTSVASASDGGTSNGGVVTWTLGTVGVGGGGQVRLELDVENSLQDGQVLEAKAILDPKLPNAEFIRSSAATPVRRGVPLQLAYTVSQTINLRGWDLTYTITASNEGPVDLLDVSIEVMLPGFIERFRRPPGWQCDGVNNCHADTRYSWNVGTLAPGENRSTTFRTSITSGAPQSGILRSVLMARSSNASNVTAALDAYVVTTRPLNLSLVPSAGPASAGEPFTYTLTFGNVGSANPSDVVLQMPVPDGTSFMTATGDGVLDNGAVTWNVGTLGAGASRRVTLTVLPDADLPEGRLLRARAEIDPGVATGAIVRASAATAIRDPGPLQVAYTVSQVENQSNWGIFDYTITVSNLGPVNLLNVSTWILLPPRIDTFRRPPGWQCDGVNNCHANTPYTWNVGTLTPGESRSTTFRTRVQQGTGPGFVMQSFLRSTASIPGEVTTALDVTVDPSRLLRLSIAPEPAPLTAGLPFAYALTFGNVGTIVPTNVVLTMPVPEGTSFVSATGGGVESNGVVSWPLGTLGPGMGGQFELTVLPDTDLAEGSLVTAHAEIDPGVVNALVIRSQATAAVRSAVPLRISYAVDRTSAPPGESLTYTITARNDGPVDLLNVSVRILLPSVITRFSRPSGWNCGTWCYANDANTWNIGTLAPGEERISSFTTSLNSDAAVGFVNRSHVRATASGSNEVVAHADMLVGSIMNFPPSAAVITSPEDGATFLIGGPDEENAVAADSAFVVEWTASTDPEGDPLTYRWQLSTSPAFSTLLVNALSAEDGAATRYETDFGTLGALLSDQGVAIGESLTLHHRVATTDGVNQTFSAPATVVLTRGTLVSTEDEPALPATFALHGNYPNPFNPSTTFAFDLPEPAEVSLVIYDALGREVATVVSQRLQAGRFEYVWDAGHLPSGVYLYRLEAGEYREMRRMVLVK